MTGDTGPTGSTGFTGSTGPLGVNAVITSEAYFEGFPAQVLSWLSISGASYTNLAGATSPYLYQAMTFPSLTIGLYINLGNPFPSEACTFVMSVKLNGAGRLSVNIPGVYGRWANVGALSSSQYMDFVLPFTAPPAGEGLENQILLVIGPVAGSGAHFSDVGGIFAYGFSVSEERGVKPW